MAFCQPARAAVVVPEPLRTGCGQPRAVERRAVDQGPDGLRAALQLGLCRLREGRAGDAALLFQRGSRHPTLRAYALLWAGQAQAASGDVEEARRLLEQALQAGLPAPAGVRARLLLAQLWLDLGDLQAAERHARAALRSAADDGQRASAWRLLGRASEQAGRRWEAQQRYAVSWWGFPGTVASQQASSDLRRMVGRLPPPPALARVERARRLAEPRAALAEWQAALRQGLRGAQAAEAWLHVGLLDRGAGAPVALSRAASHPRYRPQALFWTGVVLARTGRTAEAEAAWRRVARNRPESAWAARSLTALAARAQARGDLAGADRYWRLVVTGFSGTSYAARARWQRGWLRYRQGRFSEAERLWLEAAKRSTDRWAASSLYWAAKSRTRRGLDGRNLLREVARRFPHAYEGQRARQQLGQAPPPRPPKPAPTALPRDGFAPAPVELAALGLYPEAAEAALEALKRGSSRHLRRLASWALARAGDVSRSVAVAEAAVAPWGADGTAADAELWELSYPVPYRDVVWRWSKAYGVDPFLVVAVMREESRFRPGAVSSAGAVGLMQLLPATARGLDPSARPDSLTDPDRNVRLGVAYLAGRLRDFGHDVVMALVAYNAGPGAARRFSAMRGRDVDEFVERIPYAETRAYVRRVLESYGVYRWLYGR